MNIASMLSALATASWVAALAIIVYAVMRTARGDSLRGAGGLVIGAVILALVLTTVSAGLVFIQPEERGGRLRRGCAGLSPGCAPARFALGDPLCRDRRALSHLTVHLYDVDCPA